MISSLTDTNYFSDKIWIVQILLLCPLNILKQSSCEILQSLQSLSSEQLTNKSLLMSLMSLTQSVCPFRF